MSKEEGSIGDWVRTPDTIKTIVCACDLSPDTMWEETSAYSLFNTLKWIKHQRDNNLETIAMVGIYLIRVLFECIHSTLIHTMGTPIGLGQARVGGMKTDRPG